MAAISGGAGPFGPGFRRCFGVKSNRYLRFTNARWNAMIVDGFSTMAERSRRVGRIRPAQRLGYLQDLCDKSKIRHRQVHEVTIEGMIANLYFPPGHRLRLEVAGTNFPAYERNMNSGGNNFDEATPKPARITLHSGPTRLSRMILPVVENFGPAIARQQKK